MYAYRIPDLGPGEASEKLGSHPAAKRLAIAGPWSFVPHPLGGTMAVWRDSKLMSAADYGEPEATEDGLFYLPSKEPITPAATARSAIPPGSVEVDLYNGMRISIPIATRAPLVRRFSTKRAFSGYAGELAAAAFKLHERFTTPDAVITYADDGMRRVIFLAIAACYRLTEEALDQAGWVTTVDDDSILEVVFGHSPKASPAAGGT